MSNTLKQLIYSTPFFVSIIYIVIIVGINNQYIGKYGLDINLQFDWLIYSFALSILVVSYIDKMIRKYHPDSIYRLLLFVCMLASFTYSLYGTTELLNYKLSNGQPVHALYILGSGFINNDGGECFYLYNKADGDRVSNQAICRKRYPNINKGDSVEVVVMEGGLSRSWVIRYKI
ncbi:hypothetical protein BALOs_0750 [Halobacteriovorax sp. BALOs_7]|uniref:hypothetical protein n=1 Tax=Halobacteriovorax sp. BALOs_7 TaxID=2109558 RepID=UPI000EA2E42F|nr:hypothetical protein [Halobacteriovorax sp. BALOs_7]AYF43760.1 hypothetical protein BALOs_0750 [Halobacteriovorax sp. BALOs_7]